MQNDCTNIYQSARKIAGLTQERAAELLGLSLRSLADYESGLRLPPSDVADLMVVVYNSQILAVQHLRECTRFARELLPDVQAMALPEAVITLVEAIHYFSAAGMDHELLRIARDGVVSPDERARFDRAVDELRVITAAAIALASIPEALHEKLNISVKVMIGMYLKCLGFTNTLALLLVLLLACGLAGGFLLAVMSIRYSYTGALACYTVVFTPIGTALGVVLGKIVDKSRAENTGADGKGVVFAKAEANGFQDSPPI